MKYTTISCLVAALCSATLVLADAIQSPTPTAVVESLEVTAIPQPELVDDTDEPALELRQAPVVNPAATTAAQQYPSITTMWLETVIGSQTTWAEFLYTQTFAAVPDQWPTAGAGSIGYGTLSKRNIAARETGYAQPIVIAMQHEVVTQYIRPVTEVMIIHTVTILSNMTYNNSLAMNGTFSNGTIALNGTNNATSPSNTTLPSSLGT